MKASKYYSTSELMTLLEKQTREYAVVVITPAEGSEILFPVERYVTRAILQAQPEGTKIKASVSEEGQVYLYSL